MNRPNHLGQDPRDSTRRNYLGDDHLNPALRPSLQELINEVNQSKIMQDPVNRRYFMIRMMSELTAVDLADVMAHAWRQFYWLMWKEPVFKDIAEAEDSFQQFMEQTHRERVHQFDGLPSRRFPGKKLKWCKLCGQERPHYYHQVQSP